MHFAGLKAVGESCTIPLTYYDNNISGTITLCQVMAEFNVKRLIFSSSATVYGDPHALPIEEDFPLSTTNPYGHSKLVVEEILREVFKSDPQWNIALLRYFNLSFTTPIDIFLKPVVKGLIRYSGILFCHLFNTSSKA